MTTAEDSEREAEASIALARSIRDRFNEITQAQYHTVRHGAHELDEGESEHTRPLWPGVDFKPAILETDELLVVHVIFSDIADAVFGCRIHLPTATARLEDLVEVVSWRDKPKLMATELVWYLVCYLGAAEIEKDPAADGDVTWLMQGAEVFGPLPS